MLEEKEVAALLPKRTATGNKYTFGKVLSVCGSENMVGAAYFAACGILRSGAGLVTVASPISALQILKCKLSEPIFLPLDEKDGKISAKAGKMISGITGKYNSVVLGCGLGKGTEAENAVKSIITDCSVPVVIDADGLNAVSSMKHPFSNTEKAIITPHVGEFSRLASLPVTDIESARETVALQYSQTENVITVLKGAYTVIAAPDGRIAVSPFATSALSKGGSGDLLAGLIGGFAASGISLFDAAVLGVYIHGLSAVLLSQTMSERSVLPSDLIQSVPYAVKHLEDSLN